MRDAPCSVAPPQSLNLQRSSNHSAFFASAGDRFLFLKNERSAPHQNRILCHSLFDKLVPTRLARTRHLRPLKTGKKNALHGTLSTAVCTASPGKYASRNSSLAFPALAIGHDQCLCCLATGGRQGRENPGLFTRWERGEERRQRNAKGEISFLARRFGRERTKFIPRGAETSAN